MKRSRLVAVVMLGWSGVVILSLTSCRGRGGDEPDRASNETALPAEERPSADQPAEAADAAPLIATEFTLQRERDDRRMLSPEQDGWQTEAFAEAALEQLKQLGTTLSRAATSRADVLGSLAAARLECSELRPKSLSEVYRDAMITVRRREVTAAEAAAFTGASGLNLALEALAASMPDPKAIETHWKIVGVDLAGASPATTVLIELSSADESRSRQINATWRCHWDHDKDEPPRLTSIQVVDYEESEVHIAGGKWFADNTMAVLGGNSALSDQLAFGHHYWLQRIERVQRFDTSVRNGLAIGDVNDDGLDDLYVCQPPGLPNRLFVQNQDGTATDRSTESGVDWLDQTSAALFCDLDNDDDQDLALGTPAGILLLENDSQGKFQLKQTLSIDYDVQSLSAVDYDNDGRLDIFVCVYRTSLPGPNQSFLYRDAVGGGLNRLFRNEVEREHWGFSDVTKSSGLEDGADRYALAASWEDFDLDGDQDLYVANDFGPNYLYENRDGSFVNVAEQAGVVDIGSGMSVSWGDFNRDGLADLYVGNMFSSAGKRVTVQAEFRGDEDQAIREIYQRLAKGNSLFANLGNGKFREVGGQARVELGRWAWSSLFADLNNDGWEDILVANGYMSTDDSGDL